MPLVRYEVRCEHSLANPELYRTVGQDDSEGLLEGVAMAGLVGIVRQLGDLAEFAAEVFHDLHDDVMTIVTRSHELKARVSRLEAELPAVEKALLSEANLYRFAYSAGAKWRASLPIDENHCAQGDLPHFVRNFYQDCRGPPRLFLLDKFDMAGQGACVKRYSDPTFFRLMWASSEIEKAEQAQREQKAHQEKKSSQVKNDSDKLGPHIYPRERLSSAHFENLEGFSGDFNTPLTPRVQSKRLDQVLESPVNGAGLTREGTPTPDHDFRKSASRPTAMRGPALAPLKISAKDIENGSMGRRFSRTSEDFDEKSEGVSSGDHFVDALTTMESDMDSDADSRGRWGSDSLRDFEVDKANSQVNHSMLKAHVESQRQSPARGVDILERPEVVPDVMKLSSFKHDSDGEIVAPSSCERHNATHDRKLPTQSTILNEYEALKQNGHKDVGHFDPPEGNGHAEISSTEHAKRPTFVDENLRTQSNSSLGQDMKSSNGHAVKASREGDGISRPANGPVIDAANRGAIAHSLVVQTISVQQCVDPHVATVHPPAEFAMNPAQNGYDMHGQSTDMLSLEQDENESTSSAASSPKSSTVRMLLSPPESPPRMRQGLIGSPALYTASFRSERSTPNSPPIVPVLSSSPSASRIQSPTRDETSPDSPYYYHKNNVSPQPPPRPPLASPLMELLSQESPSPLSSDVSISGAQETSSIASPGPDSDMIKKAAFVDLASTPDHRYPLFEQIRTQGNYPGGEAFSILPFCGSFGQSFNLRSKTRLEPSENTAASLDSANKSPQAPVGSKERSER